MHTFSSVEIAWKLFTVAERPHLAQGVRDALGPDQAGGVLSRLEGSRIVLSKRVDDADLRVRGKFCAGRDGRQGLSR